MAILKVPMDYYADAKRDPAGTARNYFSIAKGTINPFFGRRDAVMNAFNRDRLNPFDDTTMVFPEEFQPEEGRSYYMHVDLGTHHDATGLSMAHVEGFTTVERRVEKTGTVESTTVKLPIVVFDFVGSVSATGSGEEVLISDVRDLIFNELQERGFFIKLVTFDRYGSTQILQELNSKGFTAATLSLDRTTSKIIIDYSRDDNYKKESTHGQYMAAWNSLREAVYEGRIDIPYHSEFLVQCKRAQENRQKKRVESVISGYSLDMLESIAGTVFNISNNEQPGVEGSVEDDPDYRRHAREEKMFREELGISDERGSNDGLRDLYTNSDEMSWKDEL